MLLRNLHIVGEDATATDIYVHNGKIGKIGQQHPSKESIDLNGHIIFPGLVNAHDHLDFNLFPSLGSTYGDYTEWGRDIHERHQQEIAAILQIPKGLRIQWGLLKNILNGVTTVVDHSRIHQHLHCKHIDIISGFSYMHSIALERYWKLKLNNPFSRQPVMIHIGEGTSDRANDEIDELIHWNILKKPVIGVHGIAMDEDQAAYFKALVWCPASNFFLYDKTAPVDDLKKHTHILFGTDSTLSAPANLWEHLRMARGLGMLTDQELFHAITATPAEVFGIINFGRISEGGQADLVIAKKNDDSTWESFYNLDLEDIMLLVRNGSIIYFDEQLKEQIPGLVMDHFSPVYIEQHCKYLLKELVGVIKHLEGLNVPLPLPVSTKA